MQNYFSDPAFQAGVAGQPEDAWIQHWIGMFGDPSLTWDDLPFLRQNWMARSCSRGYSADVVKAIALGARAVLLGRPYAFGLGLAGEDGVRHVVRALRNDFELTMRLAGLASLADVAPDVLVRAG